MSIFTIQFSSIWASLVGQLVKNPPAMQETPVLFLGWEDPWGNDRLPTPVFMDFPCGSAGKESACKVGNLASIPGLGRSLEKGKVKVTHSIIWPGEFLGLYSPWGCKESDTTE